MAFFLLAARRFGPAALGTLTILLVIGSGVGLLLGDLGVNTVMIARLGGRPESEQVQVASEAFFWKNVLCVLVVVFMCAGMYVTRRSVSLGEMFSVVVISLGALWVEFLCALTNGTNRFEAEVWLRMTYRGAVYGVGALAILFAGLTVGLACMAVTVTAAIIAAFLLFRRNLIALRFELPARGVKLLRESVPVWVTQLAQLTYLKFDVVILGLLHVAAQETGWYAAAWKIADILTAVPALMSAAALPLLCGDMASTNIPLIVPRYLKILYVLPFLFALPLAIGAGWITRILYGSSFTGTPRILRILVWAVVPIFVHTFLAIVAVATRRQAEAAKLAAATSGLGILVAFLSVHRFGYEAMAVVCLVANSVFACAMIYKFRDVTGSMQLGVAVRSIAAALGVYGVCSLLGRDSHPVLSVLGGMGAYCIALLLLGVVNLGHLSGAWRLAGSMLGTRLAREVSAA